ncbi:hypothetical protein G4B88_017197 [Cannabis sativa]|uniref:Pentatricopeptide repeat-containing protein n=1 Tax=Cannabis sativa TaxID=3483 RepID=A0A7J6G0D9_CANSA|nr:hypothetical protein G4B88_017197 [Cannabis sativa]
MLSCYVHNGLANEAFELLDLMKGTNVELDTIALGSILSAVAKPWPEHYACFVDLLCRANHLEAAYEFVNSIEGKPSAEVWCALLRACRVYSNKELGEISAMKLLELDPTNPGKYVLISNVLTANGKWKDVHELRMRMKGSGLKKNPDVIGLKSHPESVKIYRKLD